MAKFTSDLYEIGFSKEAVRKTPQTPASGDYIKIQDKPTVKEEFVKKEDFGRQGDLAESRQDRLMVKRYNIGWKQNVDRRHIVKLFLGILGNVSTATNSPAAGANTHTLTRNNNNLLPSFTTTVIEPNQDYQYAESVVKKLELDFPIEDYITATTEVLAATRTAATLTGSYLTSSQDNDFIPVMATIKRADNVAGLGAAVNAKLSMAKITLERKSVKGYHYIGGYEADTIIAGALSVRGEFSTLYEDLASWRARAEADDAYSAFQFGLTDTAKTVVPTVNPSLTMTLNKASYREFEPDIKDDYVEQKVKFLANADDTGKEIEVVAINEVASYA